jgi:hypothetical protein
MDFFRRVGIDSHHCSPAICDFSQRAKQKELQFLQGQQKSDEEIYQLIQVQQAKIDEGRSMEKTHSQGIYTTES